MTPTVASKACDHGKKMMVWGSALATRGMAEGRRLKRIRLVHPHGKQTMKYWNFTGPAHGTGRQTIGIKDGFHDGVALGWGASHRVGK